MSTNFPTSIDTFVNPVPTSDTVIVPHSTQHANINDSVLALETKVGANSSAVTTTHDYKLSLVTGADKAAGLSSTSSLSNKTMVSPKVTVGSDAIGDMYYNSVGAVGTQVRLPAGSNGQVLTIAGGVPSYASPSSANANYIVDIGAANAYVATLSPALASYTAGVLVQFKATNANTTVSTVNVNGLGVKTIKKLGGATDLASGDIAAGMVVQLEYDGTNFVMLNPVANTASFKFGGDGTDGALVVSSGTTNIDLASSAFVVKNYTSIAITGTGKVTFTNPNANGTEIVFKSQGAVTLTSSQAPMIDASNLGAIGGTAVTNTGATSGNNGTNGVSVMISTGAGAGAGAGAVGAAGTAGTLSLTSANFTTTRQKYILVPVAAGGGSGSVSFTSGTTSSTSGAGGRGGGTLIIECAGAWNFTTASGISVAGANGGNASGGGVGTSGASGGGGGGGGYFIGLYNTLTSNTGTVTVSGGTGGNSDPNYTSIRYGGGGGALNAAGNIGASNASASAKTGGDGATGISVVTTNNDNA